MFVRSRLVPQNNICINTFVHPTVNTSEAVAVVSLILAKLTDNKASHVNLQTEPNLYNATIHPKKALNQSVTYKTGANSLKLRRLNPHLH